MDSVDVGESISHAVGWLIADAHVLPALALARVRLEQVIVTSYLVYENPDIGLKAYAAFAPITEYRLAQAVLSDEFLAPHVQDRIQVDALKKKAFAAQADINAGFDLVAGKLQSKWTTLDLYAMALKRDALVASSGFNVSRVFPLAALYTSLYKTASSVVHADASALGPPFRGIVTSDDSTLQISAAAFWRLALPVSLVTFDLLQCYEALRWSGVACDNEFLAIAAKLA
jgi:hypothetical protein